MVYKNNETKWIIILCSFMFSTLVLNIFYKEINDTLYITLHALFLIGCLFSLLKILKNIEKMVKEIRTSNLKLQTIFETTDIAIWYHDMKKDELLISAGIEKIYGRPLQDFYANPDLWRDVIVEEDTFILEERFQNLGRRENVTSIYRIVKPNGDIRWIKDKGIPEFDQHGNMIEFTSVLLDITESKENEERFSTLVDISPDIIAVVSNYQILYINNVGKDILGIAESEELKKQTIDNYLSKEDYERIKEVFPVPPKKQYSSKTYEVKIIQDKTGAIFDVEISCKPILFAGKHAILVVGKDITKRKATDQMIKNLAYFDQLTNLPNRNSSKSKLNELLFHPSVQSMALLFVDLDQFKRINDTKGHSTGDIILQQVAKRLQKASIKDSFVSRLGGDEFLIFLENKQLEEIKEIAGTIMKEISFPFLIKEEEFFISASIGISLYPEDGSDQETLIKNADAAMFLAKENGKNNFQFYSSTLAIKSSRKMELEMALRKAIQHNELVLYYQPQVNLHTNKIIGFEALLRWIHPTYGFISPEEFIPLAEETNLIFSIGEWVFTQACKQKKKWDALGTPPITMSVNISAKQFQCSELAQIFEKIITDLQLNPNTVELEITESIMQNIDRSIKILNELKKIGFLISIDDFGKGYSSLSYLKHLPIDTLKIDKSFVDDINDPVHKGSLVKAIIDMGQNMNFSVIAEGIEKLDQVHFLVKNNCKMGQGYFYSKPLPKEEVEKLLLRMNDTNQ
ncbi:sensor domain-containing protein [Niallia nealsonii]|nr:EAL domain-containing protein [Niallia nealsonii]